MGLAPILEIKEDQILVTFPDKNSVSFERKEGFKEKDGVFVQVGTYGTLIRVMRVSDKSTWDFYVGVDKKQKCERSSISKWIMILNYKLSNLSTYDVLSFFAICWLCLILLGFSGYHPPGSNFMYKGFALIQRDVFQVDIMTDLKITQDCRVCLFSVYGHLTGCLTPELQKGKKCTFARLQYNFDGDLVLFDDKREMIWHSNTGNKGFSRIQVKNNKFIFS